MPCLGGLRAPCMPRLAARGDLLSRACRAAEPGCQTAPVLAAPPHSVICEGQGPLRHSVLPLSNHLPGAWHYPSALLPEAAPQGSFVSPERAGVAGRARLMGDGGGAGGSAGSARLSRELHNSALPSAGIQLPWQHPLTCRESIFPIKLSE